MDKRYQIFVSSTYSDLIEERKEATQAILKCNCFPAGMELFPASNKQQWNVIKQVIDDSDFYLLIIAGRYGSLGTDDSGKKVSYTEMEFDYALSRKKPIIVMVHRHPETLPAKLSEKTDTNIKRLEKFRDKAMSGRMVAFWENKDQLHGEILSSLHKMMASTPEAVGWMRANAITPGVYKEKEPELSQIIAEFKAITNVEQRVDYIGNLSNEMWEACFAEREFLKEFVSLIDLSQPDDVISKAINWAISYRVGYKARKYILNQINIETLFYAQFENGKIRDSELSNSIIRLLDFASKYSADYSKPIFDSLKAGNISDNQKYYVINYVGNCYSYFRNKSEWESLLNYIKDELNNSDRAVSVHDLTSLLAISCNDEKAFVEVYNIFISSSRPVQQEIINSIFNFCGGDLYLLTPRIQRMFFDMCDKVYSWNDDETTADLLLFCLFTRTYDIYTTEEIFDKLNEFNDDVFYLFFWQLGAGEFGRETEEVYNLDDEEKVRIVQIIKDRKHPREKKLLEHFR